MPVTVEEIKRKIKTIQQLQKTLLEKEKELRKLQLLLQKLSLSPPPKEKTGKIIPFTRPQLEPVRPITFVAEKTEKIKKEGEKKEIVEGAKKETKWVIPLLIGSGLFLWLSSE